MLAPPGTSTATAEPPLTVGNPRLEALQVGWKESCRGMEFALNFLRNNAGIDSPALLSSPFMLIVNRRDCTANLIHPLDGG